jgi:hypothetical protein
MPIVTTKVRRIQVHVRKQVLDLTQSALSAGSYLTFRECLIRAHMHRDSDLRSGRRILGVSTSVRSTIASIIASSVANSHTTCQPRVGRVRGVHLHCVFTR